MVFASLAMIVLIHPAFATAKSMSRAEIKQMVVEEAQNSSVPPALALAGTLNFIACYHCTVASMLSCQRVFGPELASIIISSKKT